MARPAAPEDLWEQFHEAVTMPSAALRAWLLQRGVDDETPTTTPDSSSPQLGLQVLAILRKRRTDATPTDEVVMQRVVDLVRDRRGDDLEPRAGDEAWREELMDVGHDPLRAPGDR